MKMRMQDEQMWLMGQYVLNAVSVAIEHGFAGKKAKSKYLKEPMLSKAYENDGLSQDEIDERELNRMLLYEEQWSMNDKRKGLPETKIL